MAKHEFGIMPAAPGKGVRYDAYEPHKYDCISVDDDVFESAASVFDDIDCFWHTRDVPGKGLALCGITLIPPASMGAFMAMIEDVDALAELLKLVQKAHREQKWIIHFGL